MDFVWYWGVIVPSHSQTILPSILFCQALPSAYHHTTFHPTLHVPHPSTLTNYYMTQRSPVYKILIYHFVFDLYPWYPCIFPRPDRIDLIMSRRKRFKFPFPILTICSTLRLTVIYETTLILLASLIALLGRSWWEKPNYDLFEILSLFYIPGTFLGDHFALISGWYERRTYSRWIASLGPCGVQVHYIIFIWTGH
jgi:hypothetical protein